MRRRLPLRLVLGAALALVISTPVVVSAQVEPVKPYIVLITDTSGSMDELVASGVSSCAGGTTSRMDHAKCAIQNIVNSYGEMVLGLARFRISTTDTDCSDGCSISTQSCSGCNANDGGGCSAAMSSADQFELVVPVLEDNQSSLLNWVDYQLNLCANGGGSGACATSPSGEPELFSASWTPLAGSLKGAKRYWQGNDPFYTGAGDDPIRTDPLKDVFTAPGEQCRPYITILLTDGDETCADFDPVTTDAADALLVTTVDGQDYRIVTKPIGFGKSPGDAQIEALAHAGGAPDVSGVNEGAYAQNEEELQVEISQILADAIKFEVCNGVDDDCDTNVDEGFDLGTCDDGEEGVCHGTGHLVCNPQGTGTTCVLDDPGDPPTTEACNGLDDDCDGTVDEGVCVGCTDVELCNNMDDDCDGPIDEDLTRPCGTDLGVCTPGTETCVAGDWEGCTGTGPTAETCNGLDDDCDGTVDGFAEACSDIPGGNPEIGPCHPGTHVCPSDGSGEFGPCIGEVGPAPTESCDLVDNDCDGPIDEDTGGADCSSSCGSGTTVCVNGVIECDAQVDPTAEDICNGHDDDCDGHIDEDAAPGGTCDGGGTICNGNLVCMNGGYVCVGEGVEPELCNCEDDNCNTQVDEGDICPTNSECVHPTQGGFACQCAEPCDTGEFPCPVGRVCVEGYCLVDPCAGVSCTPDANGDQTECVGGECVRSCDLVTSCPTGLVCYGPTGTCEFDDCRTFPERCGADELCVGGTCVSDPCAGVTCDSGEYCFEGACYGSCAGVECPIGQRCQLGECEANPCGAPCPFGEVCNETSGECQDDLCSAAPCPEGERCNPLNGQCEQDPCAGITCPGDDEHCDEGTCFGNADLVDAGVDAGDEQHVTTGGGGGCDAGGDGGGIAVVLLAIGFAVRRRARAEVRS